MNHRTMSIAFLLAMCVGLASSGPRVHGAAVAVCLPQSQGAAGSEVDVPISVRGAQGLGPLQMEVIYDPGVLEVKTVSEGPTTPIGLLDFHVVMPGCVRIAMTGDPQKPIQGDASVLLVKFLVRGQPGKTSPLSIENLRAWEQTPAALDMLATAESGTFTVAGPAMPASTIYVLVAVLVLLVIVLANKRKKPQPS